MTVPGEWTSPLRSAAEVREADRRAIEDFGVPGGELMERAAGALADAVMEECPDGLVVVICGKGNNGGDGLAAARILEEKGRTVEVHATCLPSDWTGDSAAMLERLGDRRPSPVPARLPDDVACVVDCLLGTGANGEPRGPSADAIDAINDARSRGAKVVACDVPSGVDASTGEVAGCCVLADVTVTFHATKVGLAIRPGKEAAGRVVAADIGIPGSDGPWDAGLIDDSVVIGLPEREAGGDKFEAGSVIVAGGSPGLTGAPLLAAMGAARGGAGYVSVALPEPLLAASDAVPEVMGIALHAEDGHHCEAGAVELVERSGRTGAIVLGPGLGRSSQGTGFVRLICVGAACPLVIDADALRSLGEDPRPVAARLAPTVLTPHEAELGSLLGLPADGIGARRLACATEAAARFGAVVVLKGDDTLVADPDGNVAVSRGGAPCLATAGSGDVLAGLVASLLARGTDPFRAAAAAVRMHVEAGRIASRSGGEGVIAGDIASALPSARTQLAVPEAGR